MADRQVRAYSDHSELLESLLKHRSKFATGEEFKSYAVAAVRRFIADLRALGIEAARRANYLDRPPSHHSPTAKLGS
jgi:hypothetical protein